MARQYGHIIAAIWNDKDFRRLAALAQRAYLMLATQANISSAGMLEMTLQRWSKYAPDTPADSLLDSLSRLQRGRFIVFDQDTEELLVRKFVKWDGGFNNPKRVPAITAAANAVISAKVAAALARELDELGVPHSLSDSHTDTESDTPRVVEALGDHRPQPTTLDPQPTTQKMRARERGARLPDDWQPSTDLVEWARGEGFADEYCRSETAKFADYWHSTAGAKSRKADWDAAWRYWIRNGIRSTNGNSPARKSSTTDDRMAEGLRVAARLADLDYQPPKELLR